MNIYKGDVVGRLSYNKDILFVVDRIIQNIDGTSIAILKGVSKRIEADSPVNDLEKIDSKIIKKIDSELDNNISTFLRPSRVINREKLKWYYSSLRWR